MAETKRESAGSLKVGRYVIFDGVAYVVRNIDLAKTGKHGSSKARIEATSLIDERKVIKIMPSSDSVEVPIIEKKSAQVLSISGDKANVMDMETYETFDLEIPDELKSEVKEGSEILYWIIVDDKVMKQVK
ncbi:MAG: translation initiation factor IF-5A [Candidatus Nanoarchaeia archaeon]|jgi:translation initiation factor 5A|nr:translation initiation factor IF-5A [Candidatus Nanoarchaeia archaeon]|tara:strand:- start:24103 stop:24495 length:393 start_codon:yes stop_codon:yes gene_type:complete